MPKRYGSPNMSDTTLLVSVEDLINMAMGPQDVNVVNFKMIQTVLHILARQLRMLETQVEIRIHESVPKEKKQKKPKQPEPSSGESSSPKRPSPPKSPMKGIKEEKVRPSREREKEVRSAAKDQQKAERSALKDKERQEKEREKALKDKEKAERAQSKERDKAERAESKEREKAEKAQSKEKDKAGREESKEREKAEKAERAASKEREKAEKAESKEKDKAERAESKEREKAEKAERAESKEREKAEKAQSKEKDKAEREESKEREKAEKAERAASKEREKAEKVESKEKDKAERAESKEREKAEKAQSKEKEKAERAESKEREKAEKAQSKEKDKAERAESKEREKAEKSQSKEKDKAERAESKEREKAEKAQSKEKDKAEKEEAKDRERAERAESKEREKSEKAEAKEREHAERAALKEKEKTDRAESRDREKMVKAALKEREAAERAESKERDKQLKAAVEIKEKTEREESRMREKQMRADSKEREKAEKAEAKERERAEKEEAKEREKAERAESKERDKAEKEEARGRAKSAKAEMKDKEKAERAESKDKEKMEKSDAKEKEKALKEQEKMEKSDAKEKEKALKEQEKMEKADAKEKEKALKEQEKMSAKDKEKAEKAKGKSDQAEQEEKAAPKGKEDKTKPKEEKGRGAKSGKPGISIKEKDKVLIVEKGPTTRPDSRTRVGSIEVVTLSQFELLEATVKDLTQKAGPLPFPAMPDNEKLRRDLTKGSASLTDTMQAMQVAARVQAAELAIGRMAGLLTQLAAAGALPQDVTGKLDDVKAEMDAVAEEAAKARQAAEAAPPRKSVAIDPLSKKTSVMSKVDTRPSAVGVGARPSISSRPSATSRVSLGGGGVTHTELDNAVRSLKDDLTKNVNMLTAKATAAAESAAATAKAVSDKLDIALKLNTRINTLYSLVSDYAEQLSGFDAGLTTQMQSFQEQMAQMRSDLKGGITLLDSANNNAETAAVMELTERYEGLVAELDTTLHAHTALTAFQKQLADELHSLLECVETLREQKADRDEVQDGLRDKADNSRLAGLLTEADFAASRAELERRLDLCYDKFRKQEQVWMGAIRDLTNTAEGKAEIMQLLAARDDAQQQLRDIQDRLQQLAAILGEPKAAMVTRQLSVGARCGACLVPALQEPQDASAGQPPRLPAVRPRPAGAEQPCLPEWRPPHPPEAREHTCHRWVGGSHTLLADSTVREQAGPLQALGPPTKRYTGYGSDGRLYMMEEQLQPCVECNMISTEADKLPEETQPEPVAQADGAGDTGLKQMTMELPDAEPKT